MQFKSFYRFTKCDEFPKKESNKILQVGKKNTTPKLVFGKF